MPRINALAAGAVFALAQAAALHAQGLVALRQVSAPALLLTHPLQHSSAIFTNYDDSEAVQGAWHVWIRHHACAVTPTGVIRLTVYRTSGLQNTPLFVHHLPSQATQYARPVILWRRSDYRVYVFTAAPKSTYYYKVDILGRTPCSYWGMGATTN